MENHFNDLGRLAWLWMNSKLHGAWSTRLMMRNLIPPINTRQYMIIEDGGVPRAYVSWAFFSKEAELRYIAHPENIQLEDWNSGDRLWLIDFISPFSRKNTLLLKQQLCDRFPTKYAHALRVRPGNTEKGRILTFFGKDAPSDGRQQAETQILEHFATREPAFAENDNLSNESE